ncbi:MAG: deoxyguanosinetriphosphate triphosphohydrolase [Chloroflexota bacterium]|nr:deoxyguanosinetriphosphate triphosphohydrolase [Chloroflexota bacterium]
MLTDYNIRNRLEEREESLSPYASKSKLAQRDQPEESSPMRTEFQRDRDRIIHTNAFRRLKHKTQVFIAPQGDHYVTRLTHTLEVSQIARTIARALNLNEDLTEAISLGHDLGHTPFGHVGEDILNELHPEGFRHNVQSLRVVEFLERDGKGLNLTREVREGILKHSKSREGLLGDDWQTPDTLEGQICKISDTIAYVNHDIGDALRAGIITIDDLPRSSIDALGGSHSVRIDTLVSDVIKYSWAATGLSGDSCIPTIALSPEVLNALNALRDFLFKYVYDASAMQKESQKARETIRRLYEYFTHPPQSLPKDISRIGEGAERAAVDYIAGMTDLYAQRIAAEVLK